MVRGATSDKTIAAIVDAALEAISESGYRLRLSQGFYEARSDEMLAKIIWSLFKPSARVTLFRARCSEQEYGPFVYTSGFSVIRAIRTFDAYKMEQALDAADKLHNRVVFKSVQDDDAAETAVRTMLDECYRLPA